MSAVDGQSAIDAADLLEKAGVELIADYGAYAIIYVPKSNVAVLEAEAGSQDPDLTRALGAVYICLVQVDS